MIDLIDEFETILRLPDDIKLWLLKNMQEEHFKRKEYLLKCGQVCRKLYFIRKGIVYGFFNYRGQSITMRFAKSGELCVVPESFIRQTPSKESLQAVYPSVVYSLSYEVLQTIYKYLPEFRKVTEHYFIQDCIQANNCLGALRSMEGLQRYKWLKDNRPDLLRDVPMRMTSYYIGLSSTTLSKLIKKDIGKSRGLYRRADP